MEEKLLHMMVPLQPNQGLHARETVFSPHYCRATLVRQQTQFVVRGDASAPDWPRQYKAESLDISLHLSRSGPVNYLLLGILTGAHATQSIDTFEGMDAELYASPGPFAAEGDKQAEKPLLRTQVDDLGYIVFSNVPEGE